MTIQIDGDFPRTVHCPYEKTLRNRGECLSLEQPTYDLPKTLIMLLTNDQIAYCREDI